MFDLDKITVEEFFLLSEEDFNRYMKLEKILLVRDDRFNCHRAKDLGSLEFGQISTIKLNLKDPTFDSLLEIFEIVYRIKKEEYLKSSIVEYFYALKYVKKEIREMLEKERKLLKSEPDEMMEMAGSKRLEAFGDLSTLIQLGRSFSKSPEEIERWSYNIVFSILVYDKIKEEIRKDYMELTKKK